MHFITYSIYNKSKDKHEVIAVQHADTKIKAVYEKLYQYYGPQKWWPADTPFEVMMGAILTQNTAWENVEKALNQLRPFLKPHLIFKMNEEKLGQLIRPSGFYNIKAKRIKSFLAWFHQKDFSLERLKSMDISTLRNELLAINGIGKETADAIILYALDKPIFVIDAYTRRLFKRLGFTIPDEYDDFQKIFERNLDKKTGLFNEFHALIVIHSKRYCRKKPLCDQCFLKQECPYYKQQRA